MKKVLACILVLCSSSILGMKENSRSREDFSEESFEDEKSTSKKGKRGKSHQVLLEELYKADDDNKLERVKLSADDLKKRNKNRLTLLHSACEDGRSRCVRFLLNCNADINAHAKGFTPLLTAATFGHHECVALLLEAKAGVDTVVKGFGRLTPLYQALRVGFPQCVDVLLRNGAAVKLEGAFDNAIAYAALIESPSQSAEAKLACFKLLISDTVQKGRMSTVELSDGKVTIHMPRSIRWFDIDDQSRAALKKISRATWDLIVRHQVQLIGLQQLPTEYFNIGRSPGIEVFIRKSLLQEIAKDYQKLSDDQLAELQKAAQELDMERLKDLVNAVSVLKAIEADFDPDLRKEVLKTLYDYLT